VKTMKTSALWFGAAILVLVLGGLAAAILVISTLGTYPALIAEAYQGPRQKVEVPGVEDLELSRKGAYAVYYEEQEGAFIHAEMPPNLDCELTSTITGKDVPLVSDYVPTNRYVTRGDQVGVLIYSTTVNDPGMHTLSCDYPVGRDGPKLVLAIGPNYFFEFLRVVWNMSGSVLGGVGVLCGSFVLSFSIAAVAIIQRTKEGQV